MTKIGHIYSENQQYNFIKTSLIIQATNDTY